MGRKVMEKILARIKHLLRVEPDPFPARWTELFSKIRRAVCCGHPDTSELVAVFLEIYLHEREFFVGASECVLPQEIDGLAEFAPKNVHFFKALGDAVKD